MCPRSVRSRSPSTSSSNLAGKPSLAIWANSVATPLRCKSAPHETRRPWSSSQVRSSAPATCCGVIPINGVSAAATANGREAGCWSASRSRSQSRAARVANTLTAPATTTGTPTLRNAACTTVACRLVRTRTPMSPGPISLDSSSVWPSWSQLTNLAPEANRPTTSLARSSATNLTAKSFWMYPHLVRETLWSLRSTSRARRAQPQVVPANRGAGGPGWRSATRYTISGWPRCRGLSRQS